MGWIMFMIFIWSVVLLLVPLKYWKKSWPMGVFAFVGIYVIDNTLVNLGAFKFWHGGVYLSQLPLYYWLAYFPGGIIFDFYRPHKHILRLLYIFTWASAYLAVELAMIYSGYFQYFSWNAFKSFQLNIIGFTLSMWFAEWLEQGRKNETAEQDF